MINNIGLVGGAGYIGSKASHFLSNMKKNVTVYDTFYFENKNFFKENNIKTIYYDSREKNYEIFNDLDLVIDLASISNDPAGELDQELTKSININGRINTIEACKAAGVKYYILASSCSVYGFNDSIVNEESEINPLTMYAKANSEVEKYLLNNRNNNFYPLIFRQATVYGMSPRLRLDLVVNGMTFSAFKNKRLRMLRDGDQWRPLLGLEDLSHLFTNLDKEDFTKNAYEIFNIGFNENNFQIKDIGKKVLSSFQENIEIEWYGEPDHRSYRVDFSKSEKILPIKKVNSIEDVSLELLNYFKKNNTSADAIFYTLEWYKKLIAQKKL